MRGCGDVLARIGRFDDGTLWILVGIYGVFLAGLGDYEGYGMRSFMMWQSWGDQLGEFLRVFIWRFS
ncbi:hypothetical protein K440DRAFT_629229, partial [Wilcoxina mikolae CBS 423.85]